MNQLLIRLNTGNIFFGCGVSIHPTIYNIVFGCFEWTFDMTEYKYKNNSVFGCFDEKFNLGVKSISVVRDLCHFLVKIVDRIDQPAEKEQIKIFDQAT